MAFVLDLLSVILRKPSLAESAWIVQLVGTMLMVAAVVSGLVAQNSGVISEGARNQFELHQQLAFLTAVIFLALFLWRIGSKGRVPDKASLLYFSITAVGIGFLIFTAWAGAELVYVFGAGVNPH